MVEKPQNIVMRHRVRYGACGTVPKKTKRHELRELKNERNSWLVSFRTGSSPIFSP
jgi:hypothetical protein